MLDVLKDFEWYRDRRGYRIVPFGSMVPPNAPWRKKWAAHEGSPWIVPNGKQEDVSKYKPFARGADLCPVFASVKTAEALLRFVNDHGPLTQLGVHSLQLSAESEIIPAGEDVSSGLREAEMFRELLRLQTLGNPRGLASHFESKIAGYVRSGRAGRVEIVPDSERGVRLRVVPPHLLGAIWCQLALKLPDAILRECPHCHEVFEVGHGTRRADARFCCNEHKIEYFNRAEYRRRLRRKGARDAHAATAIVRDSRRKRKAQRKKARRQ
jgi:hypothetical protein